MSDYASSDGDKVNTLNVVDDDDSGSSSGGEGDWKAGRPGTAGADQIDPSLPFEGYRECNWDENESYKGQWKDDMMHGQGTLNIVSGIYQGQFVLHQMHGPGRFDSADGTTYIGDFVDNLFEGTGVIGYSERCVYAGEFIRGKREGKGTMVFDNDDKFEGDWKGGIREGKGVYTAHMQKEIYVGEFRNNRRHGDGVLFFAEKSTTRNVSGYKKMNVLYENGELVKKRTRPPQAPPSTTVDPRTKLQEARAKHAKAMGNAMDYEGGGTTRAGAMQVLKEETDSEGEDFLKAGAKEEAWGGADDGQPLKEIGDEEEDDLDNNGDGMDDAIDRLQKQREALKKGGWASLEDEDEVSFLDRLMACVPFRKKKEEETIEAKGALGKVDCVLWVKVIGAKSLPAFGKYEFSNCFAEVVSRGQKFTTKVIYDTIDPTWEEKFEMAHSTTDEVQELIVRVLHKGGRRPQLMGVLVRNLNALQVGMSVPDLGKGDISYDLLDDKEEPVKGTPSADGRKHISKVKIQYGIKYQPDALLTVRILQARKLIPPHFKSIGNPFCILRYGDVALTSQGGKDRENPNWGQTMSFDVYTSETYSKMKGMKRETHITLEVWDPQLMDKDVFIGGFKLDITSIHFGTRADAKWHTMGDTTRPRRENVGKLKCFASWGANEMTTLRVHVEEGIALQQFFNFGNTANKMMAQLQRFSKEEEKDKNKKKELPIPDAYLRLSLDAKKTRKTEVKKQTLDPVWNQRFVFNLKQSEITDSMFVQCLHANPLGGDDLIGMANVDLRGLVLDGRPLNRWYRLEDPELSEVLDEREKAIAKAARREASMKAGIFPAADEDEEEDEVDEEDDLALANKMRGGGGGFMGFGGTKAATSKKKLQERLDAGCDPSELGRVKIGLTWVTMEDAEDKAAQAVWESRMADPMRRRVLKRLMIGWVRELTQTTLNKFKRDLVIQRRQAEEAINRFVEKTRPKFFSAWQEYVVMLRHSDTMRHYADLRLRLKPVFEEWYLLLDTSKRRARVEKGLPPDDPRELLPEAPLDLNGSMAPLFKDAAPVRIPRPKSAASS